MRQEEDKELRDFEIRQWFYLLQAQYLREGISAAEASALAYDDVGVRFCLRKTSLRRAKNFGLRTKRDRAGLMVEVKSNLAHLKATILKLEKAIDEQS